MNESSDTKIEASSAARPRKFALAALAALVLGAIALAVLQERREQVGESARAQVLTPARPSARPLLRPAQAAVRRPELVPRACPEPGDCACHEQSASELLSSAAPTEALDILNSAADACKKLPALQGRQAEAQARLGDAGAAPLARRLSLEQPKNAHAAYALARVAYSAGDTSGAKAAAERARDLGRGAPAQALLGKLALDRGDVEGAQRELEQAIAADRKDVEAQFYLGQVQRRLNNYRLAREAFLAATRGNPNYPEPRIELLRMALSVGALDDARHHFRLLSSLLSETDPLLIDLGRQLQQGKKEASSTYTVRPASSVGH